MSEELEVLKIVTHRLNEVGVPYIVSGSIAANYYTVPRMTRDIDIVIELKTEDVDRFVSLFEKDFYVDKETIKREVSRHGMFNLIHNQYVVKIDFIMRKDSDFQRNAFLRKKDLLIDNSPVWLISAEDLVLAKLEWAKESHSETQLKDARNLLETVSGIDVEYIKNWVERMGLNAIYKELNNE